MGAGTIVMLNLIKPGILKTMTSSVVGQLVFVVAAGLYAIGFLLIRRVTRIEA
jgi:tight adherence protein B